MAKSQQRAKQAKPAQAAPEVVADEERGGMSWQDGVAVFTSVALLAACLVCLKALGEYGYGMFA